MPFVQSKNTSCATCGQTAGIFICRGCSQNFCMRHTNDHRELLEKQMNQVFLSHNQLKQDMVGQTTEHNCDIFLQQIERWEQQSINKIRQVANDTRQQVLTTVRQRTDNVKEKLALLTKQLSEAREYGNYFENDISEWTEKLQKLKRTFIEQQKIQLHEDRSSPAFISKISLDDMSNDNPTESFPRSAYQSKYQRFIIERNDDPYKTVNSDYSSGVHSFRFKIKEYGPNTSVILGIISKTVSEDIDTYINRTFYGWSEKNLVYLGDDIKANYNGYKTDIQADDIFMLNIDCDRESISLTNERTARTHVLDVDIRKCPFPWQPNVRFIDNKE
ncbi:unnamed protein product [Adineta steineri]|uniref:B box-type domain-containing protein n=1 Tax=Adineta steineri TaxID=433720 RepID=A0A815RDP2_9BILA|nr:unnamed protein product [Adineta steineri]CAF1636625.1 unnamed protein product [Adineta steineri]